MNKGDAPGACGGESPPRESVDHLLTYTQLSAYTAIPVRRLYIMVKEERIPHIRLGQRTVRFRLSAIEAWLEGHAIAVAERRSLGLTAW